jgi:hypothetical protein
MSCIWVHPITLKRKERNHDKESQRTWQIGVAKLTLYSSYGWTRKEQKDRNPWTCGALWEIEHLQHLLSPPSIRRKPDRDRGTAFSPEQMTIHLLVDWDIWAFTYS